MKKLFLTLAIAISLVPSLQAQIKIGPKGGLSFATFLGSNTKNDVFISYYVGTMAQIDIGSHFKFQPEMLFAGEGAKFTSENKKNQLQYLNIPLLLNYTAKNGFFLVTGPQLGLLMEATTKVNNDKSTANTLYNPGDFSWVVGAGYRTPFNLCVDGRYNVGLTDVSKNDGQKIRNSVIQIGLYYPL